MRVAICDDQQKFQSQIVEYFRRYESKYKVDMSILTFQNGVELLAYYETHQNLDLIILDIMMDGLNGIEVAKEIREYGIHTKIVFLSSSEQYAIQGYVVNASRYWLKPIEFKFFCEELNILVKDIDLEEELYLIEKTGITTRKIYFDEIVYIETYKRKIRIRTINYSILTTKKMKEYEERLRNSFFVRCHAAYIVNMNYIKKINGLEITLKNDEQIFISKNRKSEFSKRFIEFTSSMVV